MSATMKNTLPRGKGNTDLPHSKGAIARQWDEDAPVTLHGYMPFFAEYLHSGGLFERLVSNCPLRFTSNNAPKVPDVIGTMVVSILSGHTRYCHAQSLYGDTVVPDLLGIGKMVSHDSLRRAFINIDEKDAENWLRAELLRCQEPLLSEKYVLDLDPTVKPLYGGQEGAEVGYNPKKPGRPSHCLHTYCVAKSRLIIDAEVHPGKETAGRHSHAGLWELLDNRLPVRLHPYLIRGDIGFGNEGTMSGCEARGKLFLFKLRQSLNVKRLIVELQNESINWVNAGGGWQGCERLLLLQGWSKSRRVIVLRRQERREGKRDGKRKLLGAGKDDAQGELLFPEIVADDEIPQFEWAVLITNLEQPIETVAQLYRERGDCENAFDELKNQWGWGGFTTQDIKRSSIMARLIALVYNWWNIFCRLADPEKHMEARTSRPMLQNVIGRLANHGGKRLIHLTAVGAQAAKTRAVYDKISAFLSSIQATAAQLTREAKWAAILKRAFVKYLGERAPQAIADGPQLLLLLA